jgi:hypothetical protein
MKRFNGALTALVTPFIDGRLDEQGLVDLIEFQINGNIHASFRAAPPVSRQHLILPSISGLST